MVLIREATGADAAALLALQHRLDIQSSYMLLEPDEREIEPDRLAERLGSAGRPGFDLVAVAEADSESDSFYGWLSVDVLPYRRARHVGYVVLGVDAAMSGRGIGGALLDHGAAIASGRGLSRLELTVMCDNTRAIRLYERHGFVIEGTRTAAVMRDGVSVDEFYMGRLL